MRRRTHTLTPNDRRESAFTLVEVIIAIALLGLVMAVLLPAAANMIAMSNRASANSQASGDAGYALQLMEADLRKLRAQRGAGGSEQASVKTALSSLTTQSHDIIQAGPQQLEFWSDVTDAILGPERVSYSLRTQSVRSAAGPCDAQARRSWCIIRTVRDRANAILTSEVLTHGAGTFPADSSCVSASVTAQPRLFCYKHQVPAGLPTTPLAVRYGWTTWTRNCAESWGAPPPGAGNWTTAPVTFPGPAINTYHERDPRPRTSIRPLDTITAIGIVSPAGGRTDGERGLTTNVTAVDLRNRASAEYMSAIMCGTR